MRYFIVIERTFNNQIDASSENEAIKIALDKFENNCQTDIWIESEEEDKQSFFLLLKNFVRITYEISAKVKFVKKITDFVNNLLTIRIL